MTYKEAQERIAKLLPSIKSKSFRNKATGNFIKIVDLVARTKDDKNPDVWDIYGQTEPEKLDEGYHTFTEIRYQNLLDDHELQN